mgnify:CR=1 FL=1
MPWTLNREGYLYYEVSKYVKEELPTWDEFYHDFYQQKQYRYDPSIHTEKDLYWEMPRRLYLMSICCNQINMRLFEFNEMTDVVQKVNSAYYHYIDHVNPIIFQGLYAVLQYDGCDIDRIPTYHITKEKYVNPFVQSYKSRLDVRSLVEKPCALVFVGIVNGEREVIDPDNYLYDMIMDIQMARYKDYFENGVGWKDEDGNVITSPPIDHMDGDPAL